MALTWDFARQLDAAAAPGSTVSYLDMYTQSFYTDDGNIRTQIGLLDRGLWADLEREDEAVISTDGYNALDIEHNFNGRVFGLAQHNSDVVFLVYEYMTNVSDWVVDGDVQLQADNPIKSGAVTLINADSDRFDDTVYSIFSPGSKVDINFYSGNSDPYPLTQFFVEGSPFSVGAKTVKLDGRNRIGYQLATQTLDEAATQTGTRSEILAALLTHAGVPDYAMKIEEITTAETIEMEPSKTVLAALLEMCSVWDLYIDDLANGTIVIGSASYMVTNASKTGIYSFDRGHDLKSRSVNRQSDSVYSRVAIQRDGENKRIIYGDVPYFEGWYIAGHKTFYQKVPDTTDDATMDSLLSNMIEGLQYYGVVESFGGLFRPHLQIGDVAIVTGDDVPRISGIMTEVKHSFGRKGFYTDFTVASGGKISDPDNPSTVATKYVNRMGGANRQRRMIDYILQGEKTLSGTSNTGATGNTGAQGTPGADGTDGASAYDVWLSLGNTGTEQDFIDSLSTAVVPIGAIQLWPTGTAPSDWMLCDGQAISRTVYADLFGLIGTAYGAGDGTTTFNLPTMSDPVTGISYMIKAE
jgi:hypothetical protein